MSATAFVLIGYGTLTVVGFGVRTVVQRIRTGSSGWRVFVGNTSWQGTASELLILLATIALVASPIAVAADGLTPWWRSSPAWLFACGVGFALGLILCFVAQLQMGASWRIGVDERERTALITHGLFHFVRNPIYSTMFLAIGALVMAQPTTLAVIAFVILCGAISLHVRYIEEPHLRRQFGEPYRRYVAQSARFVPGVLGRTPRDA